jgi:regulator of nucleoside diphosphate kinase
MKQHEKHTIFMSDLDHKELVTLVELSRRYGLVREDYLAALERELRRAQVLPYAKVPRNVVTMNSAVQLRDLDTDELEKYELVYPDDADIDRDRISVLAPVGTAVLGYRVGDVIEWPVPAGVRRLRVEKVTRSRKPAPALSA